MSRSRASFLDTLFSPRFAVPGLDGLVFRVPPVVPKDAPEAAAFSFNALSFTGTGIFVSAVLSGLLMSFSPGRSSGSPPSCCRAYVRNVPRRRPHE